MGITYNPSAACVQTEKISVVERFCKETPKSALIIAVSMVAFGTMAITFSKKDEFSLKMTGICGLVVGASLLIKTAHCWNHLIRHVAHEVLHLPYIPKLNHPLFVPKVIENAELKYLSVGQRQQIPVLKIDREMTPSTRGYAQGYLLGRIIWDLKNQVLPLMIAEAASERKDDNHFFLEANVKNLFVRPQELEEFEGIFSGYQQWAKEAGVSAEKAEFLDFLLKSHMLTDTYKAIGSGHALKLGCSTAVCKDPVTGEFMAVRLLDWVSLGMIGRRLFIKSYPVHYKGVSMQVFSHTFPGFIGAVTAWNDRGLLAIVNELGVTTRGKGSPYNLFVKRLIEECGSLDEAEAKITKWQQDENNQSASSFSLMIADSHDAALYHFYPAGDTDPFQSKPWGEPSLEPVTNYPLRELTYNVFKRSLPSDGQPLIVTNHAYTRLDQYINQSVCDDTSKERLLGMWKANSDYSHLSLKERMNQMIVAAGVSATIGVYVFNIKERTVCIGNDNYNAARLLWKIQPFPSDVKL